MLLSRTASHVRLSGVGSLTGGLHRQSTGGGTRYIDAIKALDARFRELGSDAVLDGLVECDLDPLAMALGVFPIAQLAHFIYQGHHVQAVPPAP